MRAASSIGILARAGIFLAVAAGLSAAGLAHADDRAVRAPGPAPNILIIVADDLGFAVPAFKPDEALQRLKRDLRDLGLVEREGRFERRGSVIARAVVDGELLRAARVKRPSRTSPEWIDKPLRSSADMRDFVADLKKQLAQWSDRDD